MPQQPRVLYVCYDVIPAPKGASTHVTSFVGALAAAYEVTLVSLAADPPPPTDTSPDTPAPVTAGTYHGARHLQVAPTCPGFLDRAVQFREAVWDRLAAEAFEVVHFRTMWAALPVAEEKARRGFSVLCEVNGVDSIELKYHFPGLRSHPKVIDKLKRQERLAFDCADALITPSAVTAKYLTRRGVEADRVTVIPNGVDLTVFSPGEPPSQPRSGPVRLLYIGTLAPWQGVDFLLEALALALRAPDCPALELRIVGPLRRQWVKPLQKLVARRGLEGCVELQEPVPHGQVVGLIREADICLAPLMPTERNTVQGCNPVKLFEYMACAKAIVATRLPVTQEVLSDGEEALLFSPSKPSRLTDCLLRLAADEALRAQLGAAAREKVAKRFQWRHANEALLEVYRGLLGEERRMED